MKSSRASAVPFLTHEIWVDMSTLSSRIGGHRIPAPAHESAVSTGSIGVVPRQPLAVAWYSRLAMGMVAVDTAAIAISLVIAALVRFGAAPLQPGTTAAYAAAALAVAAVWLAALWGVKSRAKRIIGEGLTEYQRVTNATLLAFGCVAIVCYVAQIDFARGYVAVAMPLGWVLLLTGRVVWRDALLTLRRS